MRRSPHLRVVSGASSRCSGEGRNGRSCRGESKREHADVRHVGSSRGPGPGFGHHLPAVWHTGGRVDARKRVMAPPPLSGVRPRPTTPARPLLCSARTEPSSAHPGSRKRVADMTNRAAVEDEGSSPSPCWCCGAIEDAARLVHLGNHPEVVVCTRCAHSLSRWAWEIEDQARTGLAVRARGGIRRVRKNVVRRGWHQNKIVGRGLRWLGRFAP